MKYSIKYSFLLFTLIVSCFTSCKKWTNTTALEVEKPKVGSDAYYQNLKAYKNGDHAISFGWFGNWSAQGSSSSAYLSSLPDSVDMVSIWGNWQNLSAEKQADLKKVQTTKGTKALVCFILAGFGSGNNDGVKGLLKPGEVRTNVSDSTIAVRHAKALVDSINKYGYDGFDLDWEPDIGGYYAEYTENRELFQYFVLELSKYLGPKSGTGKKLCIDGQVDEQSVAEVADCFDYFIEQAYGVSSDESLQNRYNYIKDYKDMSPKKYIITCNFESYAATGGGTFQSNSVGTVPGIVGFAAWNPKEGRKGGIGAFHMEYEYPNPIRDYHFLRWAMQLQNPAPY